MKRIDINACFGHWQYWDLHHKTPDQLVASMDSNGIDQAAVMSLRGLLLDWRAGNEETLAAAQQHSGRLIPVATVSPFQSGNGETLRELVAAGMRAVRLYPAFHNYPTESEFVDDICLTAAECQIPVIMPTRPMMNWRFNALPIDSVGSVAVRHPNTTIVLSGPNYLVEFQASVSLMKRCRNVFFDITCLQGFNSVARLVQEVGAERVLLGTGAALNYPACNVAKLDNADVTEAERNAIASENAARILGLRN